MRDIYAPNFHRRHLRHFHRRHLSFPLHHRPIHLRPSLRLSRPSRLLE
jgi:hypothetical protein